jgi:hypothetical protein
VTASWCPLSAEVRDVAMISRGQGENPPHVLYLRLKGIDGGIPGATAGGWQSGGPFPAEAGVIHTVFRTSRY